MKIFLRYIFIIMAIFLVGLMFYASIAKIFDMIAVKANPDSFNKNSITYHYRNHQFISYLHISIGMLFLLTGGYQFVPYFRNKFWAVHRLVGKIFLISSLIVSISAIVMAIIYPFGDSLETITTIVFGTYLLAGTWYAFAYARKRLIRNHKAWVVRVYFVALSIGTIRIVAAIGMALTGSRLKDMLGISFVIAFILHALFVEIWIRYIQKNNNH